MKIILQAHDSPVRTMVWSHNDSWMVTGDHAGYVKYWQSNMNNVKMFQAHKEALRGIRYLQLLFVLFYHVYAIFNKLHLPLPEIKSLDEIHILNCPLNKK